MSKAPTGGGTTPSTKVSGDVRISGVVQTDLPKEILDSYKKSNGETNQREDTRLLLEKITLGSVIVVAVLSLIQTKLTRTAVNAAVEANNITRENFTFQSRPWVGIVEGFSAANVYDQPSGTHTLKLTFKIKNSGNSPAVTIIPRFSYQRYGASNFGDTKAAIDKLCKQIEGDELPSADGYFLLPGGDLTEHYNLGTLDDWKGSNNITGCMVYKDVRGGMHHTRMCYSSFLPEGTSETTLTNCGFQSAD